MKKAPLRKMHKKSAVGEAKAAAKRAFMGEEKLSQKNTQAKSKEFEVWWKEEKKKLPKAMTKRAPRGKSGKSKAQSAAKSSTDM